MRCCDVTVPLLVFVVLIGCGPPANSSNISSQMPLADVLPVRDTADDKVTFHWEHEGQQDACRIALPNRTSSPIVLRFRHTDIDGQAVGVLFLDSDYSIEVGKILSDQTMIFVRPDEVIPIHDQLYHVTFDDVSLDLTHVTDSIPQHYHPHPQHLVISRSEVPKIREKLYFLRREDWSDYERVRVTHIASDGSYAEYVGKPYYGSAQGVQGDNTIQRHEVVHQWANSTTDVANIVPPIEIEGVGRLRGWVEFRQTLNGN